MLDVAACPTKFKGYEFTKQFTEIHELASDVKFCNPNFPSGSVKATELLQSIHQLAQIRPKWSKRGISLNQGDGCLL